MTPPPPHPQHSFAPSPRANSSPHAAVPPLLPCPPHPRRKGDKRRPIPAALSPPLLRRAHSPPPPPPPGRESVPPPQPRRGPPCRRPFILSPPRAAILPNGFPARPVFFVFTGCASHPPVFLTVTGCGTQICIHPPAALRPDKGWFYVRSIRFSLTRWYWGGTANFLDWLKESYI